MFYEEEVVNGVLHYRTSYKGVLTPFTLEELTARVLKQQEELFNLEIEILELREDEE